MSVVNGTPSHLIMVQLHDGVSVIIPAYNEAATIADVICIAKEHPLVDEVIVISDGSTDETAERARQTSARVIELRENIGKGDALDLGIRAASHDILVFLDADTSGLTPEMISVLISAIRDDGFDMFTLQRDRVQEKFHVLSPAVDLSGERALRRELWHLMPAEERRRFWVEVSLNYYAAKNDKRVGAAFAPGLTQMIKERKYGLLLGFIERLGMLRDWMQAYGKLHGLAFARKQWRRVQQS